MNFELLIIVILFWAILSIILNILKKAAEIRRNRNSILMKRENELDIKKKGFEENMALTEKNIEDNYKAIEILYKEKSQGFPWLAKAFEDYSFLRDEKIADYLETKKHPARRAAEQLREFAMERREAQRQFRITKYLLEMYESLFPFLIDFRGEDLDDYIKVMLDKYKKREEVDDEVITYTTEGERTTLAKQEIFQRALNRYWQKKKSPWELGRDYERYIGYLYEKEGYSVYYQGIVEGFEDLGRDLIIKKGKDIGIV